VSICDNCGEKSVSLKTPPAAMPRPAPACRVVTELGLLHEVSDTLAQGLELHEAARLMLPSWEKPKDSAAASSRS